MTIYSKVFDLSGKGPLQDGCPKGAVSYAIIFEPDANGNAVGSVSFYYGAGTNALSNRLCVVGANKLRVGNTETTEQTQFTLVPSNGAAGLVRVKFSTDDHAESSSSL